MEKISVSIRVRPLDKQEAAKGSPWKITDNTIALCNASGLPQTSQTFTFDSVFGSESKTLDIYAESTKDIVASAVKGFNGTVFAYGQTSSGKTYTMRGTPQELGIIPLAVEDVFRNLQLAGDREFLLRISYMEIYNEEINDLLAPEHRKLQVHESLERGIFVAGLREEIVASPEQVLQLMEFGEAHRHVGETNMNVYSSRSHTIFRMVIESRDKSQDDSSGFSCDAVRVSVLNLVDLAGSERIAKTGAEGARLKEGTHINKSLMTLGTVINKLSEGIESQGGHVPYRDSKLTRILQPALGGNAKTAIICNITPAMVHVDESRGTLQFASRAIRVTNCAKVNEILTDAALLKRQKKEIEELRCKLKESHSDHFEEEILNLRNTLLKSEYEREQIALELQEEKKAHAERERQQAQKIENLSTMVLNSAVDDRDFDKRNKKNMRRETWCPRIPVESLSDEDLGRPYKENSKGLLKRDRAFPLPPPFERLVEEDESNVWDCSRCDEDVTQQERHAEEHDEERFGEDCALPDLSARINVADRKRKFAIEKMTVNEMKEELLELQARYQDLEREHETQIREKTIQIEDLQKRSMNAEMAANKTRKINFKFKSQENDRRCRSLEGWEADGSLVNELEAEVHSLQMEKLYMQRDLDRLMEQAKGQTNSANQSFEELFQELKESKEEALRYKQNLDATLIQVEKLQKERDADLLQHMKIFEEICDLESEAEGIVTTIGTLQELAIDSMTMLNSDAAKLKEILQLVQLAEVHQKHCAHGVAPASLSDSEIHDADRRSTLADLKEMDVVEDGLSEKENILNHYCIDCMPRNARIEELEAKNDKLMRTVVDYEAELAVLKDALMNERKTLEELVDQHNAEMLEVRSELSSYRKEAKTVKAVPSALEKEKDSLRRDLEKTKSKVKETEVKLKIALQEKSKLETEKVNTEKELKILRGQSTLLQRDINRRESIADKKRESIACGINKAKSQLSCTEQALQMKCVELEKTNFDLQLLQDLYAKLTMSLAEADDSASLLKKKVQDTENQLSISNEEKERAVAQSEATLIELEAVLKELKATGSEMNMLRGKYEMLNEDFYACKCASLLMESCNLELRNEKEELALQLTEAYLQFEEEKAAWAASEKSNISAKERENKLYMEQAALRAEELEKKLTEAYLQFEEEKAAWAANEKSNISLKERENKLLMEETALLAEEAAKLKLDLESCNKKCLELQKDVSTARSTAEEERMARIAVSSEVVGLREKLNELEESRAEEKAIRSTECLQMSQLTQKLCCMEDALTNARREENQLLEVEKLQNDLQLARGEVDRLKTHYEHRVVALQTNVDELNYLLQQSRRDWQQAETMKTTLSDEKKHLLTENLKLQVGIDAITAKAEIFYGRLGETRDEVDSLQKAAEQSRMVRENMEQLKKELAFARHEIEKLKMQLGNVRVESEIYQQALQLNKNQNSPDADLLKERKPMELFANTVLQGLHKESDHSNSASGEVHKQRFKTQTEAMSFEKKLQDPIQGVDKVPARGIPVLNPGNSGQPGVNHRFIPQANKGRSDLELHGHKLLQRTQQPGEPSRLGKELIDVEEHSSLRSQETEQGDLLSHSNTAHTVSIPMMGAGLKSQGSNEILSRQGKPVLSSLDMNIAVDKRYSNHTCEVASLPAFNAGFRNLESTSGSNITRKRPAAFTGLGLAARLRSRPTKASNKENR